MTDSTTTTPQTSDHENGGSGTAGPVKNVIVMIGDGAGYNTLEATRLYL